MPNDMRMPYLQQFFYSCLHIVHPANTTAVTEVSNELCKKGKVAPVLNYLSTMPSRARGSTVG
jgi:hypothetical protein